MFTQIKNWHHLRQKKSKITPLDVAIFLRQFATLLASHIAIIPCCDLLEKSQTKIAFSRMIYKIKAQLLSGKSLASSMQYFPEHFDHFTLKLIQIGEHTGQLDTLLLMVTEHYEKKLAFKQQLKHALFYPCLLLITTALITFSLLLFVIPHFALLFKETQTPLPLITTWIFTLAFLFKKSFTILCGLCAVFGIFIYFYPHKKWPLWQKLKKNWYQLPFIQPLLHKTNLASLSRNLAITLKAGLPLTEALSLQMKHHNIGIYNQSIMTLHHKINAGFALHSGMATIEFFPALMVQMTKIGEESGQLEKMLDQLAIFFENEIATTLIQFSKLLEPLIMLCVGVLIGGLVIGMYLPIFKLGSAL